MLTQKRSKIWLIYLIVITLTLIVRIGFSFGTSLSDIGIDVVFSTVVQIVIFGIVPYLLYTFIIAKNKPLVAFNDFGFKKVGIKNWLRTLAIAVLMIFTATFISLIWHVFLNLIGFKYTPSKTDYSSLGILFLEIFITAILPGFFEEFTHRGLIFSAFSDEERDNNKWFIVLISATLFSLMHQNIRQTAYTFYDGIILALLFYYTKSIFPPMIVHFLNNFSSVLSGYSDQNGGIVYGYINKFYDILTSSLWGLAIFAVLFALSVFLIVLIFKDMKKDYEKQQTLSIAKPIENGNSIDNYFDIPELKMPAKKGFIFKVDFILIVILALGFLATLFTFIWGIIR